MKRLPARVLVFASAMLLAAPAAAQDAALGLWRTQTDSRGGYGHVRVYQCGAEICGQLLRAFDASGTQVAPDLVGRRILWAMQPRGGGDYVKGKIYSPYRDRVFDAKMELRGDVLSIAGCFLGICRAHRWTRLE